MPLQLLQVAAGGEEHPKEVALLRAERTELARVEHAGQLGPASLACEPGEVEPLPADGTVARRVRGGPHRSTPTLIVPHSTLMSSSPAPEPTSNSPSEPTPARFC